MVSFERCPVREDDKVLRVTLLSAPRDLIVCGEPTQASVFLRFGKIPNEKMLMVWDFPCEEVNKPNTTKLILRIGNLTTNRMRELILGKGAKSVLIERPSMSLPFRKIEATTPDAFLPAGFLRLTFPEFT